MHTILILFFSLFTFASDFDGRRAEGRVHEMSFLDMAGYAWKNLVAPERYAPPALAQYFDAQHSLADLPRSKNIDAKIIFVGDLMWVRSGWANLLSPEVKALLFKSDGVVGNLETVISRFSPSSFLPDLIRYTAPETYLDSFENEGESIFAALSTANNHTLDYGDEGALDTAKVLARRKIPQSGIHSEADKKWVTFERKGIKFGFYAATFGFNNSHQKTNLKINVVPGLAPDGRNPNLSEVASVLEQMQKEKIDVKIISLHWGHEFEYYPTADQMNTAKKIVSLGADIIQGSHPHVQQPDETCFLNGYEQRFKDKGQSALDTHHGCLMKDKSRRQRKARIMYSLGNFTTAMIPEYNRVALIKEMEFFRTESGVDWNEPKSTLLYNDGASIFGERRLVLLAKFLAELCGEGVWKRACPRVLSEVNFFLDGHIFGRHEE